MAAVASAASPLTTSRKRRASGGGIAAPFALLHASQPRQDPELSFASQLISQYRIDLQPLLDAAVRVRDASHRPGSFPLAHQRWWLEQARKLLGHVTSRVYFTLSRQGSGGRRVAYYEQQSGFILQHYDPLSYGFLSIVDDDGQRHELFFRDYQNPPAIVHQLYDGSGSLLQESYGGWELVPSALYTISEEQLRTLLTLNAGLRARHGLEPFFRRSFMGQVGTLLTGAAVNPFEMTAAHREAKRLHAAVEEEEEESKQ